MTGTGTFNIRIVTGDNRPIFRQIVDAVRMQIAQGELSAGAKLPSVRGLALQLTINPNTVAKAYSALTNQGLVEARQGLGLYVAEPRQLLSEVERERRLRAALDAFVNEVAYLGYDHADLVRRVEASLRTLEAPASTAGSQRRKRTSKG